MRCPLVLVLVLVLELAAGCERSTPVAAPAPAPAPAPPVASARTELRVEPLAIVPDEVRAEMVRRLAEDERSALSGIAACRLTIPGNGRLAIDVDMPGLIGHHGLGNVTASGEDILAFGYGPPFKGAAGLEIPYVIVVHRPGGTRATAGRAVTRLPPPDEPPAPFAHRISILVPNAAFAAVGFAWTGAGDRSPRLELLVAFDDGTAPPVVALAPLGDAAAAFSAFREAGAAAPIVATGCTVRAPIPVDMRYQLVVEGGPSSVPERTWKPLSGEASVAIAVRASRGAPHLEVLGRIAYDGGTSGEGALGVALPPELAGASPTPLPIPAEVPLRQSVPILGFAWGKGSVARLHVVFIPRQP